MRLNAQAEANRIAVERELAAISLGDAVDLFPVSRPQQAGPRLALSCRVNSNDIVVCTRLYTDNLDGVWPKRALQPVAGFKVRRHALAPLRVIFPPTG